MIVLKKRILIFETTCDKPSVSLVFCDLLDRSFEISVDVNFFALISFVVRVGIRGM